jgi:hypothetical protein
MPKSMPDAAILLKAAIRYLEEELMPTLEGYHRFQTRVTVNVLSTLRRELEMRGAQAGSERTRLMAIIGHDGDVEAIGREIAERLRGGGISPFSTLEPLAAKLTTSAERRLAASSQSASAREASHSTIPRCERMYANRSPMRSRSTTPNGSLASAGSLARRCTQGAAGAGSPVK